jgi:hypothetical protein
MDGNKGQDTAFYEKADVRQKPKNIMEKPTINNTDAMFQAGSTVSLYMAQAIEIIDRHFGDGYAEEHPDLVAECIRSQAMDFIATGVIAVLYEIKESVDNLPRSYA